MPDSTNQNWKALKQWLGIDDSASDDETRSALKQRIDEATVNSEDSQLKGFTPFGRSLVIGSGGFGMSKLGNGVSRLLQSMPDEVKDVFITAFKEGLIDGITNLSIRAGLKTALKSVLDGFINEKTKDMTPQQLQELQDTVSAIGNSLDGLHSAVTGNGELLTILLTEVDGIHTALQNNSAIQKEILAGVEFLISETDRQLISELPGEFDAVTQAYNELEAAILSGKSSDEVAQLRLAFRQSVSDAQNGIANYYTAIATFQHVSQIVGVVLHLFGSPEIAYKMEPIVAGAVAISNGLAAISGTVPLAAGIGPLAAYAAIAVGAFMIFSAFSDNGPTPEQQIMEAIIQISRQIESLREEMHARFDLIEERLDTLLELSIEQISLLANLTGNLQNLSSGLSQIANNFSRDLNYVNQNLNNHFRDLYGFNIEHDRENIFGRLVNYLAQKANSQDPRAFNLTNIQSEKLEDDYNNMRSWATLANAPLIQAELPDINLGLLVEQTNASQMGELTLNVNPIDGFDSLRTELSTNTSSYLVNLLVEFMRITGNIPPNGLPRLPNPRAYVDATLAYSRWRRRAKPLWQPASTETDRAYMYDFIWDGLNLVSASGLVMINHNLFAFLGHQSILCRNALFRNEITSYFQSDFPNMLESISDALRVRLKEVGALGRRRFNTDLLKLRLGISPGGAPIYIDEITGENWKWACFPGLGPLQLYAEQSPESRNTDFSEIWLKDQIYDAIRVDKELLENALDHSKNFEWETVLDNAIRERFSYFNYEGIVDHYEEYEGNSYLKAIVKSELRGAFAKNFFDLPEGQEFADSLRELVLSTAQNTVLLWINNKLRNTILPGSSEAWLSQTETWWLLVKEYVKFGFSDSDILLQMLPLVEAQSHRLFVDLRWDELIAFEHQYILDNLVEQHGYDWSSNDTNSDAAVRDALVTLLTHEPKEVVMLACGRGYKVLWDSLFEVISDTRADYELGSLALTEPRAVFATVEDVSRLLLDCYGERFWNMDLAPPDTRIPLAYEWIMGQSLLSKPREFVPVTIDPGLLGRITEIDKWLDDRLLSEVILGNIPNIAWPPKIDDDNAGIPYGHDSISVLRKKLDPRRIPKHWFWSFVPANKYLRDALGFGNSIKYQLQRALELNDWTGIIRIIRSDVNNEITLEQVAFLLSHRTLSASNLQQVRQFFSLVGGKTELLFSDTQQIYDLDACSEGVQKLRGRTNEKTYPKNELVLNMNLKKLLQKLWPSTDLINSGFFVSKRSEKKS